MQVTSSSWRRARFSHGQTCLTDHRDFAVAVRAELSGCAGRAVYTGTRPGGLSSPHPAEAVDARTLAREEEEEEEGRRRSIWRR